MALTSGLNDTYSVALKKVSDHFHRDVNNWFINKRSSGLGIIFSVVPAAWRPGCLPFILGNVPFLLPLPSSSSYADLKDVSHRLLGAHQSKEIFENCACLRCWWIPLNILNLSPFFHRYSSDPHWLYRQIRLIVFWVFCGSSVKCTLVSVKEQIDLKG